MFQNRIFREQWKKENIPQSVFLNEGEKKKHTKHQLEHLAACMVSRSHNFQTCLDKNHSQNGEAQFYILIQATFLSETFQPYSKEFFQHISKRNLLFVFPQTQQGALGKYNL